MNWVNLKNNKCPKCEKDWAFDLTVVDGMLAHGCGFKISQGKYMEIVNDRVSKNFSKDKEVNI